MVESLRVILEGNIDYAGLFPPAALPLEEAVSEYTQLLQGPHAWMVGPFVCPVAWLADLAPLLMPRLGQPWTISALGTSIEGFRQDMSLIERFHDVAGERGEVMGYEVKGTLSDMSGSALRRLEESELDVYIEIPWRSELADSLAPLVDTSIGAKARTGGLEASMFPSNEEVAAFIHECCSLDVHFKLTAGLHHPFPTKDPATGARMHGFLNVQVASVLANALDLSRAELTSILAADDPTAFQFQDRGFRFGEWEVSLGELFGFHWGSCSVQEPIEDLTEAKLFP